MFCPQKKGSGWQLGGESRDSSRAEGWKREKANGPSIFIAKTYEMLENERLSDIISWNEDGCSFTILDVERFEQEILPVYFRHRNFSSFVRQLNMYDFHKIRNELNRSIFEHRQFRRAAKHLLKNIKRKGSSKKPDQHDDPSDDSPEEEDPKTDTQRPTLAAIDHLSQGELAGESPRKAQAMEDFMASLPDIVESEQEVKEIIRGMKKDSRFRCLSSKEDVRRIVGSIRRSRMRPHHSDGLEELSIEEEIMVQNVDDRPQRHPTLAILCSDNYLPRQSQPLICSLILDDLAFPSPAH